jgi:soluble lytic murein transglycosylase-like protein
MPTLYRREIDSAAREHGIPPNLLEALVLVESSGRADAFRHEPRFWRRYLESNPQYAGANPRRVSSSYGLCQVMFPTARELGFQGEPEMLFVPSVSLFFGAAYLKRLLEWANGEVDKALAAYNTGRGNWNSAAGRAYVAKIHKALAVVEAARG